MKIHILAYAKMPNIALLGLLEVIRARIKALLYVDFKNGRAKIHILTFISKKGRVQAQKCNFIKKFHSCIQIQTHSSGIHAIFMDFWARSVPKIAVLGLLEVKRARVKALLYVNFKNGGAKIHILTSISKKGRVQAQKCNFIKKFHSFIQIQTHSSGIHAIFMDFCARLVHKIARV